jgi:hypothetical protein
MNRSIMMRKYGLDESQQYVEQSTLLEPNNFIPSWVLLSKASNLLSLGRRRRRKKGSFKCIEEIEIEI